MFENKIEYVLPEKINLDYEYEYDMKIGKGIRITDVDEYDKKGQKTENGLQSPFFLKDFRDDDGCVEQWTCKCGKYKGKAYEGRLCEDCETIVEWYDLDLTKFGYIVLDEGIKTISPIYIEKLNSALGSVNKNETVLDKILKIDFSSKNKQLSETELAELKKHPFIGKGMTWFREHYLEVLAYYRKRKPAKKHDQFDELEFDKDNVFTSAIPVITAVLRPEFAAEKDSKAYKMKINTIYKSLVKLSLFINNITNSDQDEDSVMQRERYLHSMYSKLVELYGELFKLMNGKKGVINGKVIAGRYNFSCRNIIVPSGERLLRTDEVELPYIGFLELFRYELINLYAKVKGVTIAEGQNAWKRASVHFDKVFYNLMNYIIETSPKLCTVLINRNPSINVGSFLAMYVVGVKPDIDDKTLTISNAILIPMGGDYDGDCLNVYRFFGADFAKKFMKNNNPRLNLNIDRTNSYVNMDLVPTKDELAGFWAFCNY